MNRPGSLWTRLRAGLGRPPIEPVALDGYRRERLRDATFSAAVALMEGGFVGVLADKVYHVPPVVLALVSAAPQFGHLSSLYWARLAHGRPKVPFLVGLQLAFVLCVALCAFLPTGPLGATLLVASLVAARLVLGGIVTVRSVVWSLNYPRATRARVTARLHFLSTGILTATSFAGGALLDADPGSFRAVYAVGAALAAVGVVAVSRLRLVGEEAQLALERAGDEAALRAPRPSPLAVFGILRSDPLFARYQLHQFLLGTANMMIQAPLVYLVSRELGAGYAASVALVTALPLAFSMLTLPLWAAWIDRVHICEFRARTGWLWVGAMLLTWLGAEQGSLGWIGAGAVAFGIAHGGGGLAWNLGHNDFAGPADLGRYMALHVTLTGLRGAFAPFLGIWLYVGSAGRELPGLALTVPALPALGASTFLVTAALSVVATLGFVRLHRRLRAQSAARSG